LHGVIDRQAGIDASARTVDIHRDLFIRILSVEIEELSDDEIGNLIIDRCAEKDDSFS
jgi:hypothetical protein